MQHGKSLWLSWWDRFPYVLQAITTSKLMIVAVFSQKVGLSATERIVVLHSAPVDSGTQAWNSCLQGPLGCRRGDPISSKQLQLYCHCPLNRRQR